MCVCVCVCERCVKKRDNRDRGTQTERAKETERIIANRDTDGHRTVTYRHGERERERERERDRQTVPCLL